MRVWGVAESLAWLGRKNLCCDGDTLRLSPSRSNALPTGDGVTTNVRPECTESREERQAAHRSPRLRPARAASAGRWSVSAFAVHAVSRSRLPPSRRLRGSGLAALSGARSPQAQRAARRGPSPRGPECEMYGFIGTELGVGGGRAAQSPRTSQISPRPRLDALGDQLVRLVLSVA